jgi:thymidylate kinase
MKLIIIEGTDRVGKDELCQWLSTKADNLYYRHWGFPKGETKEDQIRWQQYSFKKEFDFFTSIKNDKYFGAGEDTMMIWNRAHLGEVVYGTLYRDYDPESWIYNLESLYAFDQNAEIYLILLEADAEFVCANDDGESFTNDVIKKKTEIALFNKAFNNSIIQNKIKIQVNEGNDYRDRESIRTEISDFIFAEHQV